VGPEYAAEWKTQYPGASGEPRAYESNAGQTRDEYRGQVGGLAAMAAQIPGGALADAVRWKRALAACGFGLIAAAALILALWPGFSLVLVAEILQGTSSGLVGPAIAARHRRPPRDVVAHRTKLPLRRGRKCRDRRAHGHPRRLHTLDLQKLLDFTKNWRLVLFAGASLLPLVSENLAHSTVVHSALFMGGLIVVPQVVVALLAPWIGYLVRTVEPQAAAARRPSSARASISIISSA